MKKGKVGARRVQTSATGTQVKNQHQKQKIIGSNSATTIEEKEFKTARYQKQYNMTDQDAADAAAQQRIVAHMQKDHHDSVSSPASLPFPIKFKKHVNRNLKE